MPPEIVLHKVHTFALYGMGHYQDRRRLLFHRGIDSTGKVGVAVAVHLDYDKPKERHFSAKGSSAMTSSVLPSTENLLRSTMVMRFVSL